MTHTETLLNQGQAAAILGLRPKTLEIWRHRGGGPRFVKIGRLARYRPSDLDDYINGRVRTSTSDRGESVR